MCPLPKEVARRDFLKPKTIIPEVDQLGWSHFPRALRRGLTPHVHSKSFEICYIVRGNLDWWVEDHVYEVQAGQFFLTHPKERHGGVGMIMNPCELYWIQVIIPQHEAMPGLEIAQSRLLHSDFSAMRHRIFSCHQGEQIKNYFEKMLDELTRPTPYATTILRSELHGLLMAVLRDYRDHKRRVKSQQVAVSPAMREVIQTIEKSDHDHWNVSELAQNVGLSLSQFRSNFARDMGCSPIEYLLRRRIRRAKRALHMKRTVTQIAIELGFSSSQHFATTFKKWVGMTPNEYRAIADAQQQENT